MKTSKVLTLSIIIVSYNTKELTIACINSIYKHAPKFPFEVVVVDNASTDGSVAALRRLRAKHTSVTLIENSTNVGFSRANNQGIEISGGEYTLLLNSDTIVVSDVLTALVSFAKKNPNAGVVAPQLLNTDKSIQASIFRFPTIPRAIAHYWLGQKGVLEKYWLTGEPACVEAVVGAAFLMTPAAKARVGMLNEKYFMYFEDIDYCREVSKKSLKVYYLPQAQIIHVHGASGQGKVNTLLIESSKKYFGNVQYYIYTFVLWSGQKLQKIF